MRFFINSIKSRAYWQYVLFSRSGLESIFAVFGLIWLIVETLDFFQVYTKDRYAPYAFLVFLVVSAVISIYFRRPITSTSISFPTRDYSIEVRIGEIFDASGAIMISSNTDFEADVAGGKIAPDSLQGQFTARYFTGDQTTLIDEISMGLAKLEASAPYPIGTTIPITTHGKTFYFTAMAELNDQGNASTTTQNVHSALDGLWRHVRNVGELQELVVPVVGTGRGRLSVSRKKMIGLIADSFVRASEDGKFADRLVIVVRPADAAKFEVNLYDVKDYLVQTLKS